MLPSRFPNLLVNGSQGIAVGMATNIPPHNLGEIIDATIHLIDHPDATPDELMQFVHGPDFPTGAYILGRSGILDAYRTGRGSIRVRARAEIVEDKKGTFIIVSELPWQASPNGILARIAELVTSRDIDGIADINEDVAAEEALEDEPGVAARPDDGELPAGDDVHRLALVALAEDDLAGPEPPPVRMPGQVAQRLPGQAGEQLDARELFRLDRCVEAIDGRETSPAPRAVVAPSAVPSDSIVHSRIGVCAHFLRNRARRWTGRAALAEAVRRGSPRRPGRPRAPWP